MCSVKGKTTQATAQTSSEARGPVQRSNPRFPSRLAKTSELLLFPLKKHDPQTKQQESRCQELRKNECPFFQRTNRLSGGFPQKNASDPISARRSLGPPQSLARGGTAGHVLGAEVHLTSDRGSLQKPRQRQAPNQLCCDTNVATYFPHESERV